MNRKSSFIIITIIILLFTNNLSFSQTMFLDDEKFAVGIGGAFGYGMIKDNSFFFSTDKNFNSYSGSVGVSFLNFIDIGVSYSNIMLMNSSKENSNTNVNIDFHIKTRKINFVVNSGLIDNSGNSDLRIGGALYKNIKTKSKIINSIIPSIGLGALLPEDIYFTIGVSFTNTLNKHMILAITPGYGLMEEQEQFSVGLSLIFK